MNRLVLSVLWQRCVRAVLRPFVWLRRFRHRRGYGVHSPFAYIFLKQVIFQRSPYYQYAELRTQARAMARREGRQVLRESPRVRRLLFRVANYARPSTIIDIGVRSVSALYLRAACRHAEYTYTSSLSDLFLEAGVPIGFLYLHDYRHPERVEEAFRLCVQRVSPASVFVVEGIRYTRDMAALWRRLRRHERVAVTFDLYDVGILFFDSSKPKQDYIINF